MTIKILLADDQCLMLESIKTILQHEPEIEIVGTAQDGQSAIAQVIRLRPDLVLIDIEMPKMNGIVATKYICKNIPKTRVIVLTSHKQQKYITEALQAGASGYLLKDTLIQELKQAIRSLGRGYSYIEAKLLTKTLNRIQVANTVAYQDKVVYLKKYHKSVYKPDSKHRGRRIKLGSRRRSSNSSSVDSGMTKASLAPIFEPSQTSELLTLKRQVPQSRRIQTQPKSVRHQYRRKILLALIAIASFVLSIIIF